MKLRITLDYSYKGTDGDEAFDPLTPDLKNILSEKNICLKIFFFVLYFSYVLIIKRFTKTIQILIL